MATLDCPICMDEFTGAELGNKEVVGLDHCHHLFHRTCHEANMDADWQHRCAICRDTGGNRYTVVQPGLKAYFDATAAGTEAAFLNGREPFHAIFEHAAHVTPATPRVEEEEFEPVLESKSFIREFTNKVVEKVKAVCATIIFLAVLPFVLMKNVVMTAIDIVSPIFQSCKGCCNFWPLNRVVTT